MSTVRARTIPDSTETKRIVALTITDTRVVILLVAMQIMLGANKRAMAINVTRARAAVVTDEPEKICTCGSLEI